MSQVHRIHEDHPNATLWASVHQHLGMTVPLAAVLRRPFRFLIPTPAAPATATNVLSMSRRKAML